MAELLYPGVTVNETQTGNMPIEGVATSTAGFVGYAKRGELNKPVLVTSWTDFVNKFAFGLESPFMANANLAYSVFGFFLNGGSRVYVSRVAGVNAAKAKAELMTEDSKTAVSFELIDEGEFGNKVSINLKQNGSNHDLEIKYNGNVVGSYADVSLDADDDNFIEYVVNGVDRFVKVTATGEAPAAVDLGVDKTLSGGHDGMDNAGDTELINGFSNFDGVRVNIIVCPESQSKAVNDAGLAYAESKMAFFPFDGLMDATYETIQTEREQYSGDNGAMYFPWIKVHDPIAKGVDKTRYVPVAGHIAGVMARTDNLRGVFKAPAGLDCAVRGAIDVKTVVTDEIQSLLNPKGINAVRPMSGAGIVVWGARTTSTNPSKRYVSVVRSMLYLRESLQLGTRWAVFEPNDEKLWKKMDTSARGFLLGEFRGGMFKGTTPEQAFFVKCDAELNPQSEIDLGRANMAVGVALNKPAEFIIINIGQWAGGE